MRKQLNINLMVIKIKKSIIFFNVKYKLDLDFLCETWYDEDFISKYLRF